MISRYVKEFKVFSRNLSESEQTHPETFYIDLFSSAYAMLAKKSQKDKEMY